MELRVLCYKLEGVVGASDDETIEAFFDAEGVVADALDDEAPLFSVVLKEVTGMENTADVIDRDA